MDNDEVAIINRMLLELEDAAEQVAEMAPRQRYTRQNPFETLSDVRFVKLFRLTKELMQEVIQMVTPLINAPQRRSGLAIETKVPTKTITQTSIKFRNFLYETVLVAMLFYAHGSYQSITGLNVFTGVSQASVSRCIHDVTDALNNDALMNQWVKFPNNMNQLNNLRARFYDKFHLPGCVGCIDGTHVAIVPPHEEEHIYVNRKGYHSLNVQLVCDENLYIIHVNSRFPGSCHDSHIWRQSNLSGVMEGIYRNNPNNTFFLAGDSGYALRPWLMTPLREAPFPNTAEERFNTCFKRVRNTIERCNGTLKNRFRCLLKHRVLHYSPHTAANIIKACVILHNMCIINNVPESEIDEEVLHADFGLMDDLPLEEPAVGRAHPDLAAAQALQRTIIRTHFR